jgi:oxalate---CoA ligase
VINDPEQPAPLSTGGVILSRKQLAVVVQTAAIALARGGITPSDRLAVVMAVAAVASLVPGAPLDILLDDLQRLRVGHVLVDEAPPAGVQEAAHRLNLSLLELTPLSPPPGGELALVLQTSGTTSRPKVVTLSHANLLASLLAPLLAGGSAICCISQDTDQLMARLHGLQPTWVSAVPTLLPALLNASQGQREVGATHRLRFLRSSSSPLSPLLQQRLEDHFGVPVLEAYGMTEAAHEICWNRLPGDGPTPVPVCVGSAAGPEQAVLGPARAPLSPGASGEVAILGPNVTAGYQAADLSGWITAADGERWFPTGDEGYVDGEGRLFLTGRLKEMINRGGEKVMPRRVDEALLQHPAVDRALAFAVPHPTRREDLATAVVLRAGAGLAERLAAVLRPVEEPAFGDLEELVASVISEVVELSPPSWDANFFLLGGDSLSGTLMISRLAEQLNLDLQATLLFTCPAVCTLAERLDQWLDEPIVNLKH